MPAESNTSASTSAAAASTAASQQPATAGPDLGANIAAFLETEGAAAGDADSGEAPSTDAGSGDASAAEGDEPSTDGGAGEKPSHKLDGAALVKAVEAKDLAALLAAMGPAADELLTSKAHKALRLQLRDLEAQKAAASTAEAKANGLIAKLAEKYGDPIAARKAAAEGTPEAVDTFVDMVEKWAGADWKTVLAWVNKGIAGRPERLEAKARTQTAAQRGEQAAQAKALEETRTWVSGVVKKADAPLADVPEVVDMVIAEIKSGLAKGVDTPAKALPLVKAKLRARYEALAKVFGAPPAKPGRKPAEPPAARAGRSENGRFAKLETNEDRIAAFLAQEGVK